MIQGYHATNHQLDKLNYEKLVNNISNHDNGALGLWCAFKSDWIKGFGSLIYSVEIDGNGYNMSIEELARYSREFDSRLEYTQLRENLILQYDYISIIELNGNCDMFIVLNFEKCIIKALF